MKAFELIGEIDEQHRLSAVLPKDVAPGQVRVIVLYPEGVNENTPSEASFTSDWLTASMSSLQQVWDNEEDAVYDNL